jgi:hypothetical protein
MRNSHEPFSPYPSVSDWWNLSFAPSGVSLQEHLLESGPSEEPQSRKQLHVVHDRRARGNQRTCTG